MGIALAFQKVILWRVGYGFRRGRPIKAGAQLLNGRDTEGEIVGQSTLSARA